MTNELITLAPQQITLANDSPLAKQPAARYLAALSESGRRPQRQALNMIANILTSGALAAVFIRYAVKEYKAGKMKTKTQTTLDL